MKLGTRVGLGHGHIALDGDSADLPPTGTAAQFSAHVRCGQRARCVRMPLGTEIGLVPGDFALDADSPRLPKRGRSPKIFDPCLL